MEYVVALLGIAVAVWMILSARNRSRRPDGEEQGEKDRPGGG